MRTRFAVFLGAALVLAGLHAPGTAATAKSFDYTKVKGLSQARYDTRRDTMRVKMSDGVELYVEVVRPKASGRFATILELSPYHGTAADRNGTRILPEPEGGMAGYFPPRGYAMVFVDLRGTGKSGGCLDHMGKKDQKDAYEIVEWAAKQKWSNGRVGMTGHSYVGSTPQMAAAQNPPHLKTIVPSAGLAWMYHHEFQHGVPYNLQWVGPLVAYEQLAIERFAEDSFGQNLTYAGCGMTQSAGVTGEAYFSGAGTDWHRERDFRTGATKSKIPMFAVHGIFDGAARVAALDWFHARRRSGDKAWIGQWGHDPGGNRDEQWTKALHAWFDKHLQQRKVQTGPRVEVFLNDEKVYTPSVWPPKPSRTLSFRALQGGKLGNDRSERGEVSYIANPSVGSPNSSVVFTSPALSKDTLVVGLPKINLVTSILGERIHLNATLYDVDPSGSQEAMAQATWAIQPELRKGVYNPEVVVPGEVMTLKLTGMAQAHRLPKGHKVRLVVASAHPDKVPTFAAGAQVTVYTGIGGTEIFLPVVDKPAQRPDVF
ncbi:MAG TPA: CocE/NonD family hydrolase [Frankiaceae bacterium]|nr:CocE/NonD family hydrolase [Frankiaceae bacterium]